jgi:hypothetical protein
VYYEDEPLGQIAAHPRLVHLEQGNCRLNNPPDMSDRFTWLPHLRERSIAYAPFDHISTLVWGSLSLSEERSSDIRLRHAPPTFCTSHGDTSRFSSLSGWRLAARGRAGCPPHVRRGGSTIHYRCARGRSIGPGSFAGLKKGGGGYFTICMFLDQQVRLWEK